MKKKAEFKTLPISRWGMNVILAFWEAEVGTWYIWAHTGNLGPVSIINESIKQANNKNNKNLDL